MTYNPRKRDPSWRMIQPGLYIDPAGCAHIFPDEVLAMLQALYPASGFDPTSRDDHDLVVKMFKQELATMFPGMPVQMIKHEREQN